MSRYEPGTRVAAISHGDEKSKRLWLFGRGVYVGDEVPPPETNPWLNYGLPNPKIVLDSGEVVWGCECWWAPEKIIDRFEDEGYEIVPRSLAEARGGAAKESDG